MDQSVSRKSTSIRLPFDYYTLRLFIIALVIFISFSLLLPGEFFTAQYAINGGAVAGLASWRCHYDHYVDGALIFPLLGQPTRPLWRL
jgi:hypothetical protein